MSYTLIVAIVAVTMAVSMETAVVRVCGGVVYRLVTSSVAVSKCGVSVIKAVAMETNAVAK
jgi:hypothetical protein